MSKQLFFQIWEKNRVIDRFAFFSRNGSCELFIILPDSLETVRRVSMKLKTEEALKILQDNQLIKFEF